VWRLVLVVLAGCRQILGLHDLSADAAPPADVVPSDASVDAHLPALDAMLDAAQPDAFVCAGGNDHVVDPEGDCFIWFSTPLVWTAAKAACEARGMHLAIVLRQDQNDAITGLLGTLPDPGSAAYLGGTDMATEGTWLWIDGTPLGFAPWEVGQPSGGSGQYEEDCLVIRGDESGHWSDRPCGPEPNAPATTSFGYVCQR
jgi:hypothetical protein